MWRLVVGTMMLMSSLVKVCLFEFSSLSKDLTIVVAKKMLVRSNMASTSQTKCTASLVIDDDTEDEDIRHLFWTLSPIFVLIVIVAKKKHGSLGNPVAVDDEGLLLDVEVQQTDIGLPTCEEKRHNVDHFFHAPVEKVVGEKKKKLCVCKLCL